MTNSEVSPPQSATAKAYAISGWLTYTVGSVVCASSYDPEPNQLLLAGLLMASGLFLLHRYLLKQALQGWSKWIQRLNFLACLLFIPGFLAIGSYGFQPGLVQLTCIYGAGLALMLYASSCVLAIGYQIKKRISARGAI